MCLFLQTVSFFRRSKSFFLLRRWASHKTASLFASRRLFFHWTATFPDDSDKRTTSKTIQKPSFFWCATSQHKEKKRKRDTQNRIIIVTKNKINEKRTSFLRARERPSLVPVLVVLELRPAFHDHAAEARVDARGCFRLDVVRGRRHDDDDDDDVFGSRIVVRFLKWLNNMLTVDDEDHTLITFYVFRVLLFVCVCVMIFFLIFFGRRTKEEDDYYLHGKGKRKREEKSLFLRLVILIKRQIKYQIKSKSDI